MSGIVLFLADSAHYTYCFSAVVLYLWAYLMP